MVHSRGGVVGGTWTITLEGKTATFEYDGNGFPALDRCYVPKVDHPKHHSDYTRELIPGAIERLLEKLEDTVWLFQANPDHFDIQGYLAAGLERITWSAKRNRARMREGQRVFIWQAMGSKTETKKQSGVVATAVIDEGPWFGPDHRPAHRFWSKKAKAKEAQWHVWLRDVEVASPKHVVKRDWVKEDPVCGDLLVLNQRTGTNYSVPEHHAGRLVHLWRRAGRPWIRQDLLAALWTYCELGGPPTAGDVERLGQLAVLIGRGVGPTREALYKFAKLDPQVNKGRDGSRAYDAMWEEFYDSTQGNLDRARLERAYREAWAVGHIPSSGRQWEPNQVRIEEVAIEAMVAETFPRSKPVSSGTATKNEGKLVARFRKALADTPADLIAHTYTVHAGVVLRCDVFDKSRNHLIEAKAASTREHIRMAIGQLFDYLQFYGDENRPTPAVLLPEKPVQNLMDLLAELGIGCIWEADEGEFVDSAAGRFVHVDGGSQ